CLRIGAPATSRIRSRQYVSRRLTDLGFDYLASQLDRSVGTLSFAGKRLLVLLRACLRDNPVLMADEPMAELSDDHAEPLLRILNAEAQRRTVLVVTHNQTRASALGGQTIFLAGGTVRTSAPTERFFDAAIATGLEAQFLETGRVSLPSINADPRTLSADSPRPLTVDIPARGRGPRSFHWLIPGRIGGCPRPGVVVNFDEDMRELQNLGITILVNLEEEVLYSEAAANEFGIEVIHEPVRDMSVPTLERARQLCRLLKRLGESGESVAVHCRAGQGRTGLVMAMVLISHGQAPADSFRVVQAINPRWIQSDEQLEFLPEFSGFLAVHGEGGPRREANLSAEGYVR
ncbi:MAG: dual specificity protein phosphatase family protein, partial [Myxococcota bacterium]